LLQIRRFYIIIKEITTKFVTSNKITSKTKEDVINSGDEGLVKSRGRGSRHSALFEPVDGSLHQCI
jgi:hypothetical protein